MIGISCGTYLDTSLESQEGISRIAHLEDAPESIFCQIPNLQYFQLRRNAPQVELVDKNIIDDYRRLRGFIEGGREHFLGPFVEVRICR